MADDVQRLIQQVSDLRRQFSNFHQSGTVHEVKGTKLRMVVGKDCVGKVVLSPWLNTSNMRGGAREQRFYKKGQTLSMICPNGDLGQGMIAPFAPSKDFKTPEHADFPAGRTRRVINRTTIAASKPRTATITGCSLTKTRSKVSRAAGNKVAEAVVSRRRRATSAATRQS